MHKLLFSISISVLVISLSINVWQFYNTQNLNSENHLLTLQLNDLNYIKEPMVHLVDYEWAAIIMDWEHQRVDVNFTLFNSGLSPANFTLCIDIFDSSKERPNNHVDSGEWELFLNGTTIETFTKRFHLTKPTDSWHIDCIEFYCPYFFENSLGYDASID